MDEKDFTNITKSTAKTLGDIESQVWKRNVTKGTRNARDFLDTSNEDFAKNFTQSINGNMITPSNFNIFRDSLKNHSDKLTATLVENLPDLNLKDVNDESKEPSEDEEVLPLDFRTAMLEEQNKIIIQAKPLHLKTDNEFLEEVEREARRKEALKNIPLDQQPIDDYLEAVRLEGFKQDDKSVIMIEPDIDIKQKFDEVVLEFEKEARINNTLSARRRDPNEIVPQPPPAPVQKLKNAPPTQQKHYDTDTDQEGPARGKVSRRSSNYNRQYSDRSSSRSSKSSKQSSARKSKGPDMTTEGTLDFNRILASHGLDIDKLVSSSDDEGLEVARRAKKAKDAKQKNVVSGLVKAQKEADAERAQAEAQPISQDKMLDSILAEEPEPKPKK